MRSRAVALPVALLDACVLVPMPLADTLLRLAEPPALFEARWSAEILAEMTRTLVRRFGKSAEKARYREASMRKYFPNALVEDYHVLKGSMRNHPKDRHVLAASVASGANYLVTFNLKDFPPESLRGQATTVVGPSTFLKALCELDRDVIEERLGEQAGAIGISVDTLVDNLSLSVPSFVRHLRGE